MPEYNVGDFLAGDAIVFHGVAGEKHPDGKTYTVAAPCAEDELRLRRIVQIEDNDDDTVDLSAELDALLTVDGKRLTMPQKLLGPAFDEMTADGVTPTHIDRLASLVVTNYGVNEQAAQLTVAAAVGEAVARTQNRAERRAAAKSAARKPRASAPKGGSNSSRASGATKAPTKAAGSTPRRSTSAARKQPARKTA